MTNAFAKVRVIHLALLTILILAATLRVYKITEFPIGFNADEAALGYNAYSLLKTGHDEHGDLFPLAFKSFGDYKAPLYVYIDMPFVAALGLTEFAVRLPSVIFGVLTVLVIYKLAKKIFESEFIGLIAALLLAIAPWHLHFSRGGWEVNVATFFITYGVYAFLQGLTNKKWYYASFLSFLAAMYTYQSPKIIIPLLGLGLIGITYKRLWEMRSRLILPIIVAAIFAIPMILTLASKAGTARFSGVSIFADTGPFWAINESRGEHANPQSLDAKIFHNKVIGYGLNFLKNYSDHYTPEFLFTRGDVIDRNKIPDMGVLYLIDAILLAIGFLALCKSNHKYKGVVFVWLAIAPVAAAITFQTPHALRSANMVIPLVLVISYGVGQSILKFRSNKVLISIIAGLIVVGYTWNFIKYIHQYYVHIPHDLPLANNYAFDELVSYIMPFKDRYKKIIVTDKYDQPYVLFLFYEKQNPRVFQKQVQLTERDKFGYSTVRQYNTYEFRAIEPADYQQDNILIIATDKEVPIGESRIIKTINFPNGTPAFKIIDTSGLMPKKD